MIDLIAIGMGFILIDVAKDKFAQRFGWALSGAGILSVVWNVFNWLKI